MLRLKLRSADPDPDPVALLRRSLLSFSFSFSSTFLSPATLKMSIHRLDPDAGATEEDTEARMESDGGSAGVRLVEWWERWRERRWRGRRTPSTMSSSAVRRSGGVDEGLRTIQNSNSGDEALLFLGVCASTSMEEGRWKKRGEAADETGEGVLMEIGRAHV